jgi:hypothetical protein
MAPEALVARTFQIAGTELKSVNAGTHLHELETVTLIRIAD